MSDRFVIRIHAWPYSSGRGADVDQARAGAREQIFTVTARDICEAMEKARIFQQGMLTSPYVWQAPIQEVRVARHGEDFRATEGDPCAPRDAERAPLDPVAEAAPEMRSALNAVHVIIAEGAATGFSPEKGDWANRLFQSQRATSRALRRAEGASVTQAAAAE